MSFSNYSPANQWHGQLSVPDNGQADDSASLFDGTAKYNADNGLYLFERLIEAKGGEHPIALCPASYGGTARWQFIDTGGTVRFLCNSDVSGTDEMLFEVPRLLSAKLDQITAYVEGDGAGNTHSSMPTTKPRVTLYSLDITDGSETNEGNQVDLETTTTGYDAPHTIQLTLGTAVAFGAQKRFVVSFRGEGGGGGATNSALALYGLTMRVVPIT